MQNLHQIVTPASPSVKRISQPATTAGGISFGVCVRVRAARVGRLRADEPVPYASADSVRTSGAR